jgi:hypothetical protein
MSQENRTSSGAVTCRGGHRASPVSIGRSNNNGKQEDVAT